MVPFPQIDPLTGVLIALPLLAGLIKLIAALINAQSARHFNAGVRALIENLKTRQKD